MDVLLKDGEYTPESALETETETAVPEETEITEISETDAAAEITGTSENIPDTAGSTEPAADPLTEPPAETPTEPPTEPENPAGGVINRPSYATEGATILNVREVFLDAPEKFWMIPYPGSVRFNDSLKKTMTALVGFSPRDFGGASFYVTTTDAGLFTPLYSGMMLSDARRYRTELVEAECNIVTVSVEKTKEEILENIRLGIQTDEFISDILCVPLDVQSELIRNGYVMNLKKIPFLKLNAEYYNASATDAFSVNGNVFGLSSDLTFDPSNMYAVFYNKALVSEYGLENPVNLHKNGKWDYDGMFSASKEFTAAAAGLDGETAPRSSIGIDLSDLDVINGLYASSGGKYFINNRTNAFPILNFNGAKTSKFIGALSKLFLPSAESGMDVFGEPGFEAQKAEFMNGNVLFSVLKLDIIPYIANSEFDWGLLPLPVPDPAGNRFSFADKNAMCISVPRSTRSTEACGIVIGAMSMTSHQQLKDVYVLEQMTYYLRDVDSVNILNEIVNEVAFSEYNAYSTIPEIAGATAGLLKNAASGQADFAAAHESQKNSLSNFFKASEIFSRR